MNATASDQRDPEDMLGHVLKWPELLAQGFSASPDLPETLKGKSRIVCAGMGGSAIGAGLVGDCAGGEFTVPYQIVRDYELPGGIGKDTLVVCLSYSGGTEETLACFEAARERGAAILAVTTGGELGEQAKAADVPVVEIGYDSQPRAALPVMLGLLLKLYNRLDYLPDHTPAVAAAVTAATESLADRQSAATLAEALTGVVPIVYGAGLTAEAARRLKGQVSENAKQTAAWEVLPEQNHNALVGLEKPDQLGKAVRFVLLRTATEHPRHTLRFEIVKSLLDERKLAWSEIRGAGDGRLAQLVSVLAAGDLASVELAYRNGVDPTPVTVITGLKDRLARAS